MCAVQVKNHSVKKEGTRTEKMGRVERSYASTQEAPTTVTFQSAILNWNVVFGWSVRTPLQNFATTDHRLVRIFSADQHSTSDHRQNCSYRVSRFHKNIFLRLTYDLNLLSIKITSKYLNLVEKKFKHRIRKKNHQSIQDRLKLL